MFFCSGGKGGGISKNGGLKYFFDFYPTNCGEMIEFDYFFQMG